MLRSMKEPVIRLASQVQGVRPAAEDETGGRTEGDLDVIDPVHPSSAASPDEKRQSGGHSLGAISSILASDMTMLGTAYWS